MSSKNTFQQRVQMGLAIAVMGCAGEVYADAPSQPEVTNQPMKQTQLAGQVCDKKMVNGQAVYFTDSLEIAKDTRLVFDEPATLYVKQLKMNTGAKIDTTGNSLKVFVSGSAQADAGAFDTSFNHVIDVHGAAGVAGVDGHNAMDALNGAPGVHGANGQAGSNGGNGQNIEIMTPVLDGNFAFISNGGAGGNGGSGGSGGKGGSGLSGDAARTLYNFQALNSFTNNDFLNLAASLSVPYLSEAMTILKMFNGIKLGDGFDGYNGGNGGDGGNGANGGNGGNAGNITVIYGVQRDGSKIFYSAVGGTPGAAGAVGMGGNAGSGGIGGQRGDFWARDGKNGNPGQPGSFGKDSTPGKPGLSGVVKVTETNNPQWLGCYVNLHLMLDMGDDQPTAYGIFETCVSTIPVATAN